MRDTANLFDIMTYMQHVASMWIFLIMFPVGVAMGRTVIDTPLVIREADAISRAHDIEPNVGRMYGVIESADTSARTATLRTRSLYTADGVSFLKFSYDSQQSLPPVGSRALVQFKREEGTIQVTSVRTEAETYGKTR